MEVRYDARRESSPKEPPLAEWLQLYPKLDEALRKCSLRFVINLPEESIRSGPRLCFELQEAFWFYLYYLYDHAKKELPKLNQTNFLLLLLEASHVLRPFYETPAKRHCLLQDWRVYAREVPLKGAVLLNQALDKCLMVQPWKGDKWTYPRGKINEDETGIECAVREVWEETGIDINGLIDENAYVKADIYGTGSAVQLFLVPGIQEEVPCAPNTRKEISKIAWFQLCRLPGWVDPYNEDSHSALRFSGVAEFVPGIQRWVESRHDIAHIKTQPTASNNGKTRAGSARSPPAPRQHHLCSRRPPSRSPSPRKRQSGSSRPRSQATAEATSCERQNPSTAVKGAPREQQFPRPPPPPQQTAVPYRASRSPDAVASGGRRPGQRQLTSDSGWCARGAPNSKASDSNSSKDNAVVFSLDFAKVLREFDRGWDSAM